MRARAPSSYHSLFMCSSPIAPTSLQNRGLSPIPVCMGELPTPPCLNSHLSPPHPIATAGGGHMVHSIYRSPPVVHLQGISVCMHGHGG